jgi:hypothetical protein
MHVGDRAAVQPGRRSDSNATTSDRHCADRIRYRYIAGRDCATADRTAVWSVRGMSDIETDRTTNGNTGTDHPMPDW